MRMQRIEKKTKGRNGFTPIELICVIVILGVPVAPAVSSYRGIQDRSVRQVTISNARSSCTLRKAQQEMLDTGLMLSSEIQDYNCDRDRNLAYWEGEINGIRYKAVYPGSEGKGEIGNSSGN